VRKILKKGIWLICAAVLLSTLSGCFSITADELYSLPQASEEYLNLQVRINAVLADGAVYAPPTYGPNRQSVQLIDLDSDGVNEALAFFKMSGDKPLKIYIYKKVEDSYETAEVLEGDGTALESIRYADMDGDGISELVVGWQMSAALLHMSIYSIKNYESVQLKSADYTELAVNDMDGNGNDDVIVLRVSSSELPGEAEVFTLMADGEVVASSSKLSKGLESISRVIQGNLSDGTPAIFIEGELTDNNIITDIFAWRNGGIVNVTANLSSGISEKTVRSYEVYSSDINEDGVIEVPAPRLLEQETETNYYVIDWNTFNSVGDSRDVFTTYHNFQERWYLILPDDWIGRINIKREDSASGERTIVFSYLPDSGDAYEDFLKIYTLTGDNKDDRAKMPGRFRLTDDGDTIYAAELLAVAKELTVNRTVITQNFMLIYSEWSTGVV
jgi:hypothetical protein